MANLVNANAANATQVVKGYAYNRSLVKAGILHFVGSRKFLIQFLQLFIRFLQFISRYGNIFLLLIDIESQLQTLELLIVRLEELQILRFEEVETIAIQMQTLREREGILDRQCLQ